MADVAVIWAHGGYTGLDEARRMLARHPNLFYELSARTWPRHPRSPDYPIVREGAIEPGWLALIESMPRRFLVGSDASHRSEASERMKLESSCLAGIPRAVSHIRVSPAFRRCS